MVDGGGWRRTREEGVRRVGGEGGGGRMGMGMGMGDEVLGS